MDNLSHRWEPDQFDPYLVMIGYIFNYYLVDNFFFFAEPVLLQTFQLQQFHHYSHQVKCRTARLAFFSLFFSQEVCKTFWKDSGVHIRHIHTYHLDICRMQNTCPCVTCDRHTHRSI